MPMQLIGTTERAAGLFVTVSDVSHTLCDVTKKENFFLDFTREGKDSRVGGVGGRL